jgi:hypothetical protein
VLTPSKAEAEIRFRDSPALVAVPLAETRDETAARISAGWLPLPV